MEAARSRIVRATFCDVLETMAFMFGEAVEKEEMPEMGEPALVASVRVRGPLRGVVALAMPPSASAAIAAGILGMDPEDSRAVNAADDALKELANVVCGSLLTALAGLGPAFDVSLPEADFIDPSIWTALLASPDTLAFLVEGHPALLQVRLG